MMPVMRRLVRWTLNALTALSLLLFVATCVLWVRSYWFMDQWVPDSSRWGQILITSHRGLVYEQRYAFRSSRGFWVTSGFPEHLLPYFVPVVVFGLLPTMVAAARIAPLFCRTRSGLCATCSYDLTGNVSGVCPECGARVAIPPTRSG